MRSKGDLDSIMAKAPFVREPLEQRALVVMAKEPSYIPALPGVLEINRLTRFDLALLIDGSVTFSSRRLSRLLGLICVYLTWELIRDLVGQIPPTIQPLGRELLRHFPGKTERPDDPHDWARALLEGGPESIAPALKVLESHASEWFTRTLIGSLLARAKMKGLELEFPAPDSPLAKSWGYEWDFLTKPFVRQEIDPYY